MAAATALGNQVQSEEGDLFEQDLVSGLVANTPGCADHMTLRSVELLIGD